MTDNEALLKASIRERRRLIVIFTVLVLIVGGLLGTAWMFERGRGDSWRDQALQWQDEYVSLYDEFTTATGEEPDAPEPSDVADDTPEAIPGERGPVGPAGVAGQRGEKGLPGTDGVDGEDGQSVTPDQLAAAFASYCGDGRCVGPTGPAGKDGAASIVPGPKGDTGATGQQGDPGESWTTTCTASGGTVTTLSVYGSIPDQAGTNGYHSITVCLLP